MKEQYIKLAPLFQGFSEQELESIANGFAPGQNPTGAKLLNTGERSDAIYLVNHGFVRLTNESGYNLATLGPGSILGDASMLRAVPQDVSALAATDVEYWKLTDRALRSIILRQPTIGLKLGQNLGGQVVQMEDYLLQRLTNIPEFGTLPQNTLQAVAAALQPRRLAAGQTLYRSGEKAANLYVVESGSLELREDAEATNAQRAEPGTIIGASALLTNKPYTHSAVAAADSLVWVLSGETFQTINARHPGLRRSLSHNMRTPLGRSDQNSAATRLGQMPLFAELPQPVLQSIAQRILLQHVSAGDRVYRSGDAGDALYMIESGEIELTGENNQGILEERARIGDGGFFGEMSLLNGSVRTEDATARRNSNLWVLTKPDLDALSVKHPAISKALSQGVANQLAVVQDDVERFHHFPLLAELSKEDLRQISPALRPTRFRSGEQIFRINAPSDTLYLIEHGEVRMQQISGESWFLGEGEIFGERSLLTNQPNNASAVAETDVDLWTLHKRDFEALTRRNPSLGLNMSRALADYMRHAPDDQLPYDEDPFEPASSSVNYESTANNRRRQAAATPLQSRNQLPGPVERGGFGQWFGELSMMGKINIILLILLLVIIVGVLATTLFRVMLGSRVASGAALPLNALRQVMLQGSYDVASINQDAARALALADRQVPPTPTYTPLPTNTPVQQAGAAVVAATPEPTAIQEGVFVENFQAASSVSDASVAPAPVVASQEAPPAIAAAAIPDRVWDSRLDQLGVKVTDASVAPGQQYWRLVEARWEDESQAGGKHHLFVEVRDENGARIVGQPVTAFWGDGSYTGPTEDKAAPDYAWNYDMYAAGYAYSVKVEGLPSDVLSGAGLGDLNKRFFRIHVAYYLVYQKTTKQ
ncbi:MAG: cyclic nucleotide-binding domain-containing protein [Caldilineaceae bacterium]